MNYASTRAAERGDDFLRAAEAADAVQDRHQLFVWLRLHLHRFVPHELALCRFGSGAPGEAASTMVFHSVPLPAELLACLKQPQGPLWTALVVDWVFHGRQALVLPLAQFEPMEGNELWLLREAGYTAVLVLGLDSGAGVQPEAMFAFLLKSTEAAAGTAASQSAMATLLLPHLYLMAVRALQGEGARRGTTSSERLHDKRPALTQRELQILSAVRGAKHNAEIGQLLGITAATVKNHLRKIMRKLGASNRAQAVAEAMKRRLIV